MKKIMDKLLTHLLLLIGWISSRLTRPHRILFGRMLGNALRIISPSREQTTIDNLMASFPDRSKQWSIKTANASYKNLGITLAEVLALKYLSDEEIRDYVKYDNAELIGVLHSRGKGLILLSGHFGNWEYLAYSAGLYSKLPITVIVKPQKNRFADVILNEYRIKGGNKVISMYNAARGIVKALSNGGIVALLADQSATKDKDIFIDFFGRPAATFESPAALALKYNVPIIIGFAVRNEDGRYDVNLSEIKYDDLEYNKEGIIELSKRHVKILEDAIRQRPDLWAWQHRKWKHIPIGIPREAANATDN